MGGFKEPFSLEELTSTRFITFNERNLADVFAPSKTVGIASWGYSEDLLHTYGFGYFRTKTNDFADSVTNDGDNSFTGRLTWLPYYDEPSAGRYLFHRGGCSSS